MLKKGYKSKVRRNRRYRKRLNVKRSIPIPNQTHLFRRNGQLIRYTQTATNTVSISGDTTSGFIGSMAGDSMINTIQWGGSFVFKLSSVIDPADFTNLYDKYRLVGVRLKILYQANTASTGGASVLPVINYAVDHDDAAVPSSLNQVEAKAGAKTRILTADKPVNIYLKPKVAVGVYQGAFSGYGMMSNMYINSATPDVQHYGFKLWINNFYTPAGANNQITIQPTYYLALKDSQ